MHMVRGPVPVASQLGMDRRSCSAPARTEVEDSDTRGSDRGVSSFDEAHFTADQ
jgi:hypothetical protein